MKKIFVWLVLGASSCTTTKTTKSINPFFKGEQVGCGSFIVYKLSEDKTQLISIAMNMQDMEIKSSQSYRLNSAETIEIKWKVYESDISATLCNDVMIEKPRKIKEMGTKSGTVELIIDEIEANKMKRKMPYIVTIVLKRVEFDEGFIHYLKIENVNVGWLPG